MKRKNHAFFLHAVSAAALLTAVVTLGPVPAFADDGTQVQKELDRFGIRPAQAGEETVTGQTVPVLSPAIVSRAKDGNIALQYANGNTLGNEAILGDTPAASDPAYYYTGPMLGAYFKTDEQLKVEREYMHREMMAWSGSYRFGDDIGADYHPAFGFPGEPFGGAPTGSWIHFDRRLTVRSMDDQLLNSLQNDSFAQFSQLFAGQFDGDPIEEKFAQSRGF